MELTRKNTWYIPILYGLVVFIANFIGSQIPVSSSINLETQNFDSYQNLISHGGKAGDCIQCGQCEGVCPQHLPIIELLRKASADLDR